MSNGWAYALLGGLQGYGTGLAEQRKREAEEAKQMNLARFQQQMARENTVLADELAGKRSSESDERKRLAQLEELNIRNEQDIGKAEIKHGYDKELAEMKFGHEKGLEAEKAKYKEPRQSALDERIEYMRQMGASETEIRNFILGKKDDEPKKGGLTEVQRMKAETDLADLESFGINETNYKKANAIRKHLGMPQLKQVEKEPGSEGFLGFGSKEPVMGYEEDYEGFNKQEGQPQILPPQNGQVDFPAADTKNFTPQEAERLASQLMLITDQKDQESAAALVMSDLNPSQQKMLIEAADRLKNQPAQGKVAEVLPAQQPAQPMLVAPEVQQALGPVAKDQAYMAIVSSAPPVLQRELAKPEYVQRYARATPEERAMLIDGLKKKIGMLQQGQRF